MIERHSGEFDVAVMCRVLGVSRAGYYARVRRRPSARVVRQMALTERIRRVHERSRGLYGSPRVHAELVHEKVPACVNMVARLMRRAGLRSKIHRKFRPRTTASNHDHPVKTNRLDRQFSAPTPDRTWCVDITYVPTGKGFLYVAAVLDLCSRRVVGWQMADHLRAELCTDALVMALSQRRPAAGLLHHSDRGVQYCCYDYQRLLHEHDIESSTSRRGDCYDNAAMESFWGTLKQELVHLEKYGTKEQARRSIFEYIKVFYNRQRRHSAIGYLSPEAFEAGLN